MTTSANDYVRFTVDVTFPDGANPQRSFKSETDARKYYDKMVADKRTTRVLLFGFTADGGMDGIDGWWAD
jgi:hypothetical protein